MSRVASLIDLLAGALVLSYALAGIYFLRFYRATRDFLFLGFACAFWLFAANRIIASLLGETDERTGHAYLLRVLGFALILVAIVRKNLARPGRRD